MNLAAAVVVAMFLLFGIKLVATHRHSKDLGYIDSFLRRSTDPVNETAPWFALTLGIACLLFACFVLIVPGGVGLGRWLGL